MRRSLAALAASCVQDAISGTRSWLGLDPFVWSLSLSFLLGILVSLATAPQRKELRAAWFGEGEA